MRESILITLVVAALVVNDACAQMPTPIYGSDTYWVVDQTEEIVTYILFDPVTVKDSLPSYLRFITIGELAAAGVPWAEDYLTEEPSRGPWGISFLEIVKMETFMIDGQAPDWPRDGAIALWAARVAPSDSSTSLSPGQPLLVLEFWLPDRQYVAYMRDKGHYATFGDVKLRQDPSGKWRGSIGFGGLSGVSSEERRVG